MAGTVDAFVGREGETAILREGIAGARDGRGGVVLVSGPAGIGKSRLVEEAVAREAAVAWGHCVAEDGAPPLWPWLRVMEQVCSRPHVLLHDLEIGAFTGFGDRPHPAAADQESVEPAAATLAAAAPTAMEPVRGQPADVDPAASASVRFRRLAALTGVLLGAAEDAKGLVVVIEDLHDADEASLAMLRHVALEAAGSRLLVVATHRSGGGRASGFLATVADVSRCRAVRTVSLPPLTREEVARLLSSLPGGAAAAGQVHRRTGGLPLLVAAMARAIGTTEHPTTTEHLSTAQHGDGAGDGGPSPPPADLSFLVLGMLKGLDPAVRRTAGLAAVLGDDLDVELLADVAGLTAATVAGHLDALTGAGLLAPAGGDPGRQRFAHSLVREGIVAWTSTGVAGAAHRRAAVSLERRAGSGPAQAARVAAHWRQAGHDAEALRAFVRWARAAAAHARWTPAPEEAARLLGQALEAQDRLGAGPDDRAGLLIELATAEVLAGQARRAAAHCREAAEEAQAAGRLDLLAAAALTVGGAGDPDVLTTMSALCDRALAALEGGPDAEGGRARPAGVDTTTTRARLTARKAFLDVEGDRAADPGGVSARALRLAEESGDPQALLDAVQARAGALDAPDSVAERRRMGDLAIRTGLRTGRPMAVVRGHLWHIDGAYQLADLGEADEAIAGIGELAGTTRLPSVRWHHLRAAAARAALTGSLEQARELSADAGEIARLMEDRLAASATEIFTGLLALMRGDPHELPRDHRELLAALPRMPVIEAARCAFLHLEGDREEALARYEHLRLMLREPPRGLRAFGLLQYLTELAEAFGDAEAAGWAYALWAPWTAAGGLPGSAHSMCGGAAARGAGRMAAVMGRLDEAAGALRFAAEVNLRLDARPWLVHTWIDLAEVLVRRAAAGDLAESEALARRATVEARRLGLPGPLARAGGVAASLEARRRDPLTAREREVAGLVAQAMTNRQIADRLVLSERTVESHVRNILAKLGCVTRTELVARLLGGAS
ncbi:AAA family ATPase [Microbispora sp. NPDC049125]|uniref:ATP-binding protein n=1 Tax=Microbispora sp. NPDC049125 TaxID=3154929 RepID=UPI003466BCAA